MQQQGCRSETCNNRNIGLKHKTTEIEDYGLKHTTTEIGDYGLKHATTGDTHNQGVGTEHSLKQATTEASASEYLAVSDVLS